MTNEADRDELSLNAVYRLVSATAWSALVASAVGAWRLAAKRSFLTSSGWVLELSEWTVSVSWPVLAVTTFLCATGCALSLRLLRTTSSSSNLESRVISDVFWGSLSGIAVILCGAIAATGVAATTRGDGSPRNMFVPILILAVALVINSPLLLQKCSVAVRRRRQVVGDLLAAICIGWNIALACSDQGLELLLLAGATCAACFYALLRLLQSPHMVPQASPTCSVGGTWRRWGGGAGVIVLCFAAWRSINEARQPAAFCDGKVFTAVSWHLLQGDSPYRDAWDHKPPGIYFLGAAAQTALGPGIEAFRIAEQYNAVVLTILMIGLGWRISGSPAAGLLAGLALIALFFQRTILCGGIYTTEFGVTFVLAGAHAALSAAGGGLRSVRWAVFAGCLFAAAVLFKEPFLFSVPSWLIYLSGFKTTFGKRCVPLSLFVILGGFTTALIALAWAVYVGALEGWVDVLAYNVAYARAGSEVRETSSSALVRFLEACGTFGEFVVLPCPLLGLFAYCGLLACFDRGFDRRTRRILGLLSLQFLLEVLAASLSGRLYLPYFHQCIPTYLLLAGCGGVWLSRCLARIFPAVFRSRLHTRAAAAFVSIVFLASVTPQFAASREFCRSTWRRITLPEVAPQAPSEVAQLIRRTTAPSDRIWVPNPKQAETYVDAERRSATRFLYLSPWLLLSRATHTSEEVREMLCSELRTNAPCVVVLTPNMELGLETLGLEPWFRKNYRWYATYPQRWIDHWPRIGLTFEHGFHDAEEARVYFRHDRIPK